MVHRASVAEVFLTDVRATGPDRFQAAAQWPSSHSTFPQDGSRLHHPLMVAETVRQLGIYIPCCYFEVPNDAHYLIKDLAFGVDPCAEPRVGHGATDITCVVAVGGVRVGSRDRAVRGMRLRARFLTGDQTFAWAEGAARFLDSASYATVRNRAAGATPGSAVTDGHPEPETVGVPARRDLLVRQVRDGLELAPADPRHPFFFDHTSDHIPGMVLLEAARQATALATAGRLLRPLCWRVKAVRFTDFTPSARIEAVPHHTTSIFRVRQDDSATAMGALHYA